MAARGRRGSAKAGDAKVAVAYLRVSTDEQHLGPEAQRAAVKRWAEASGARVAAWHTDAGVSGGAALDRRPALISALDGLREHGAGVLVVAKRDRLARDVVLAAQIESLAQRAGARVVSAAGEGEGDDPSAMLMRRLVDAFAEYERALIRARTRAALAVKKERGERAGCVPFGRRVGPDGKRLEPDEREIAVVAAALELRASGLSQRAVARELAALGCVGRSGRPLGQTQVARILRGRLDFETPRRHDFFWPTKVGPRDNGVIRNVS
jgi:DNA invertase Pin-like site-specific DNA recombinase